MLWTCIVRQRTILLHGYVGLKHETTVVHLFYRLRATLIYETYNICWERIARLRRTRNVSCNIYLLSWYDITELVVPIGIYMSGKLLARKSPNQRFLVVKLKSSLWMVCGESERVKRRVPLVGRDGYPSTTAELTSGV